MGTVFGCLHINQYTHNSRTQRPLKTSKSYTDSAISIRMKILMLATVFVFVMVGVTTAVPTGFVKCFDDFIRTEAECAKRYWEAVESLELWDQENVLRNVRQLKMQMILQKKQMNQAMSAIMWLLGEIREVKYTIRTNMQENGKGIKSGNLLSGSEYGTKIGSECGNCDSCFIRGTCHKYTPTSEGPRNARDCKQAGGTDCKGKPEPKGKSPNGKGP